MRSTFLSNLPTDVFGTVGMTVQRSGGCHLAILPSSARKARRVSKSAVAPSLRTTVASGRSPHLSSGTATTAASATSGWDISAFSSSTEEIHSPPDLMTSLARSVRVRKPSGEMVPTSPVFSQPSSLNFSAGRSGSASGPL
ncbi:hypothetical protein SGLAM104S_08672 [Streptomyces glaucescens]